MVNVTLKGGAVKEYENGTTAMEIAKSLGMGLFKAACLCKINGEYADLRTPVTEDCELEILTFEDDEEAKEHTATQPLTFLHRRLKGFIPTQSLLSDRRLQTAFTMTLMLKSRSCPRIWKKSKLK